jgi:hypothetical protein
VSEIRFTREQLEAEAQYEQFFIPQGVVFHTFLPIKRVLPLIPAVPYRLNARRYGYGSVHLN